MTLSHCMGQNPAKEESIKNTRKIAKIFLDLGILGRVFKSLEVTNSKCTEHYNTKDRPQPQHMGTYFPSFISVTLLKSCYSICIFCIGLWKDLLAA